MLFTYGEPLSVKRQGNRTESNLGYIGSGDQRACETEAGPVWTKERERRGVGSSEMATATPGNLRGLE